MGDTRLSNSSKHDNSTKGSKSQLSGSDLSPYRLGYEFRF